MTRSGITVLACIGLLFSGRASAQEVSFPNAGSKALGECVVLSTTGRDRLVMIRWIAASIGSAESMKSTVTVQPGAKEAADRGMAAIFTRLFTVDCRQEAAPLLKQNDTQGVEAAFGQLGRMAMAELVSDPQVERALGDFARYADLAAVAEVGK